MKKVFCLVLILLFTISSAVYAIPDRPVVPANCPCGGAYEYMGTTTGNWSAPLSKMPCVHGDSGYDFRCYRDVTEYYNCTLCGRSITSTYREVDWVCGSEMLQKSALNSVSAVNEGRAEQCDYCYTTMSPYKTRYGTWEGPIETSQTPNGTMYKYQRTVYFFYRCPNCGAPETTTYIEYKWSDMNM